MWHQKWKPRIKKKILKSLALRLMAKDTKILCTKEFSTKGVRVVRTVDGSVSRYLNKKVLWSADEGEDLHAKILVKGCCCCVVCRGEAWR
jgi:hypothetical protein